jgi:hypothetical protein
VLPVDKSTFNTSASTSNTPQMASIEGISEQLAQVLGQVDCGDFLLVQTFPKYNYDQGSDDEADSADGEDSEAGSDEEIEEDGEAEQEGMNENQSSAGDSGDDSGDGDDSAEENEQNNSSSSNTSQDVEDSVDTSPKLYVVEKVGKDAEGIITSLTIRLLRHKLLPAQASSDEFHLYGNDIVLCSEEPQNSMKSDSATENVNITEVLSNTDSYDYEVSRATGDDIFRNFFRYNCPAHCKFPI